MKPQLRKHKSKIHISNEDVEAIGFALAACSLWLVQHIYELEYGRRLATNPEYNGAFGGEILIPIIILIVTLLITYERDRKYYAKYEKD